MGAPSCLQCSDAKGDYTGLTSRRLFAESLLTPYLESRYMQSYYTMYIVSCLKKHSQECKGNRGGIP